MTGSLRSPGCFLQSHSPARRAVLVGRPPPPKGASRVVVKDGMLIFDLLWHRRLHIASCYLAALDVGLCCVTVNRINYSLSKAKALLYTIAVTQHRSRPVGIPTSLLWVGAIKKCILKLMKSEPAPLTPGGQPRMRTTNRYQLPLFVYFSLKFLK